MRQAFIHTENQRNYTAYTKCHNQESNVIPSLVVLAFDVFRQELRGLGGGEEVGSKKQEGAPRSQE
jgi:hypothetical protein